MLGAAEKQAMMGDPFQGRELLSEKLCTQCHSVWGHGGDLGPDISTAVAGKSRLDLVGDFWNHTPTMIDAMAERGYPWPTLDEGEMGNLLSYLYYLRLFDEPGEPDKGALAWSQLRCASCHSLGGQGGDAGGPLDKFSTYPSALVLGQAMWNAGPRMQKSQIGRWSAISIFSGDEMADIQSYIRSRALRTESKVELLPLPNPNRGGTVFREKKCEACHQKGSGEGPDLSSSANNMTVAEISGMLWNHSYAMNDWMRTKGIPFPQFSGTEMADLISYLYFLGFVGEKGDVERGKLVFVDRGCATCHGEKESVGPDLAGSRVAVDPVALSAAMWNHAPEMHQLMAEQEVAWPKFDLGDVQHLVAYLQSLPSSE